MRRLLKTFKSPGAEYRGKPFWAWNGKLEEDELRRQIRLMRQMGLGGFCMHSRVGLATPYLSDEWFRLVNACVDEAKKQGMEAWLYDEDRWPSGAAGGLVTRQSKYRQHFLRMEPVRSFRWTSDVLAAFAAEVTGDNAARHVRLLARGKRPAPLAAGETFLVFRLVTAAPNDWYNGGTYLDTLSHEAVRRFIKVTHQAYKKRCGREFGKTIPAIFSDEPNRGNLFGEEETSADALQGSAYIPWTPKLPAIFKKRYGYDLLPRVTEVFFDVDGKAVTRARYHYHDCVTHLFVDAFARQIGEWCERNGIAFTGHVLFEDTLSSQTTWVGNCMRFYEYMQAPGMDLLTERWRIYDVAKQVTSVARQFGRRWRLTETYGCTGWDFPFAGHKALGDWQVALGINVRCQHLAWYTMEAEAKRDYPAGIFYQSPWWDLYPKVEDYFARINAVMTRGEEVRDLLVIHPVESMWVQLKYHWDRNPQRINEYDQMLGGLSDTLLSQHLDFDYGEEDILARHASVRRDGGRATLRVGKATYKAVVVPPLITIRATTLELLRRFKTAGGHVVFAGSPAEYVDAVRSSAPAALASECAAAPAKGQALVDAVETTSRRLSITDASGAEIVPALYLLREDRDAFYLFVCNVGHEYYPNELAGPNTERGVRERTAAFPDVRITGFGACAGAPAELDPDTGEVFMAEATRADEAWEIRTSLPVLGSRMFVIPKAKAKTSYPHRKAQQILRTEALEGRWDIGLSESNALVLDRPRYRIGDGEWQPATEILRIDQAVRDALKIPHRGGAMVQPWARTSPKTLKRVMVALAYDVEVKAIPSGDLFLALEQPATFRVTVNGVPLSGDMECGWWTDRSLRKVAVNPALLRVGTNRVTLDCDYAETHPGMEIAYLLGQFGVEVRGTAVAITAAPTSLALGDWVPQGLVFYSGSVCYARTIRPSLSEGERLIVRVPEYRGAAVRVIVNGKIAGLIAWEPNEVDVTDLVVVGQETDLRIEVIGHRRNSHGPLHLSEKWPGWTGPAEFVTTGDRWTENYQLVPCGLMAPPELVVRRMG